MTLPDGPGLVRSIGRWSLAALVLNAVIGSGIFALPGTVAARLGTQSLMAWLAAALVIGVIMACFAEVASRFTGSGGPYLYTHETFGRFLGLQMGWMAFLVRLTAGATNVNVFTAYFGEFWGPASGRAGAGFITIVLLAFLALVNFRGVRAGAGMSNVFAVAKMLPLLVFVGLGLWWFSANGAVAAPVPSDTTPAGWMQVMLLLIFAYGGFEGALMPLAEAKDPRRDAPFALFAGLVLVTLIYLAVQLAVLVVLPDPDATTRPLAEAARVVMGSAGAAFMAAAALISIYGYLAGAMLNVPRLTFAMAERGDLPQFMARIHPVYRTPWVSIAVFSTLVAALAIQGGLVQNLSLSAVSRLSTYGLICLALPVLRWRDVNGKAPALLRLPFGRVLAGLGVLFSLALATRMTSREAILLGIFTVLATIHWLAVRHRPGPQERSSS